MGDRIIPSGASAPAWVDPAWWLVYSRPLVLERLERDAWIDQLALAWRLVRCRDGLTLRQRKEQDYWTAHALGQRFHPTEEL